MKTCSICGEVKPLTDFHKKRRSLDGYRSDCKTCRKPATAAYYQKRAEEISAKTKAYRVRNKERINARQRDKYYRTREVENEKRRADRKVNPQRYRAYEQTEKRKARKKENPERYRNYVRTRRARLRNATITPLTPTELQWLATVPHCFYCNRPFTVDVRRSVDHIIPLSKGGAHSFDNLLPACMSCNTQKQDKTLYSEWTPPVSQSFS